MSAGSPVRDSHPPGATATSEEASMAVVSGNPSSMPESSPQERPSGTDASAQQPTPIESSQSASAPTDTSTSTSADPPKKQPPQVPVPSRTSSRADKHSTLEKSQETTQQESDGPLRPRRSILNRRRDKSRGSSKRSRRQNQDVVNMENSKTATNPDTHQPPPSEKKSKRSSKLFAFLTCCASFNTDTEDTVPPKKTVRQPGPNTQPTPEKIDVHTGDSSTVEPKESKHIEDEKPNLAVTPDHPRSQEEEQNLSPPEHDSQVDGTAALVAGKSEPSHDDSQKDDRAEAHYLGGPQDIPDAIAAPEKEDVAAQKKDPADTLAAAQVTEGPTEQPGHPTEEPPSAGDSDKDDTKYPADEEGAVKSPTTDFPPPPPAPPAKQEPSAPAGRPPMLLPPALPHLQGRKCLVLDLDETLVHSSFKVLERADFTIPVEIEGQYHNIYVIKRPGVDQFMKRVGELYEVVIFTASVSKYGDPLLDQLDIHNAVHHRLFRDSCFNHQGNYVKDLSQVGRNLRETIIIDNSPTSYIFHPQHAIPISSWFSDAHDNELLDLIPVLEDIAGAQVKDVSLVLDISC